MTDQKKKVLRHIGSELTLLWSQMDMWQEFFEIERDKRQELIKATAPGFFSILQASLAESILMRIFRLMDGEKTRGNGNLSFGGLHVVLMRESSDYLLIESVKALMDDWNEKGLEKTQIQKDYSYLKAIRNKWLAHNVNRTGFYGDHFI